MRVVSIGRIHLNWQTLGDQALLAYCVDEAEASGLARAIRQAGFPWLDDVVQAYTSVAVFPDVKRLGVMEARKQLSNLPVVKTVNSSGRLHQIPVCYEFGLDLDRISTHLGLGVDRIIALHMGQVYHIHAIGFCPGFPYLGYLPLELQGMPRLDAPRLKVEAGSVGLTGKQTGIYTEERPGGWNLVGRVGLELVHVADGYFPLRTGDRIQFTRIDDKEFAKQKGERLTT